MTMLSPEEIGLRALRTPKVVGESKAAIRCAHRGVAVPPEDQDLLTGPARP